jgi:putative oxidoreductase
LRRLYSTFATGWPGVGLLLMRLVVGTALVLRGWTTLWSSPPVITAMMSAVLAIAGLLLIAGLWTPVMGSLVALIEIGEILTSAGDRWAHLLLGSMAAALAMLGPGVWSIDSRLFGWKRLEVRARPSVVSSGPIQ